MSNILGKKFIEENLSFYVYKHPLIESHWRNFENFTCQKSFQRKLLKESKMSFYDVLSKKIIVEILIKNMFLHVKCLLKEINPRNFDKKEVYVSNIKLVWICIFDTKTCVHLISFNNNFLTWLLSPCYAVSANHSFLCKILTIFFNYKIWTDVKSPYFVEKNDIYQIKNILCAYDGVHESFELSTPQPTLVWQHFILDKEKKKPESILLAVLGQLCTLNNSGIQTI